ncbi:TipJ family phage tail tip protein [Yersinia enterocolitica]
MVISGRKGGGDSHTPIESPDSLRSIAKAKILIALGEGEFYGGFTEKDIYLDSTPVMNEDGSYNFPDFKWEFRSGTQDQTFISGFPAAENETTFGLEVKHSAAFVRAFTDTQLTSLRVRLAWPILTQNHDNGDITGTRVDYLIEISTDGGPYQTRVNGAVEGKTTTTYERSHTVLLPPATTGWRLRVSKLTADSTSAKLINRMNVQAVTEVIDAKFRYPNTALLYVEFDSSQFQNIPQVSVKTKMRIIRVPSNYNAFTREYVGTWDGTFKWSWSDNPAWVFYDVVINDRFGAGRYIDATMIDKWELYRIAQYCDQPVPDGYGGNGTEPRYKCDLYIQSEEDAYTVLNDIAAIYRGMTYWSQGKLFALADMPRDVDFIYTPSNIIGKIRWASGSEKNRYSTALVSYDNPDNGYQTEPVPVFDRELVARYKVRQATITAIGCTRPTEAQRRGKWLIYTNNKDGTVEFDVGLDGAIPMVGYIIGIAAPRSGRVIHGRISDVNGRKITLDRKPDAKAGDRLILNLPGGKAQGRTIVSVSDKVVTVGTVYSETPEKECVWCVDADDLAIELFRVSGVKETDEGYTISATEHDSNKYAKIDTGARIDDVPTTVVPPNVQQAPEKVEISSYNRVNQGVNVTTMRVSWPDTENAIAYEAQWRRDSMDWVNVSRTSALGFEVDGVYAGRYQARVRAINASEISSLWANAPETYIAGKEGNPPAPIDFKATPATFGIDLSWYFGEDTSDTLKTEIQFAKTADGDNAQLLTDVPYPQRNYTMSGLALGVTFYFRARLVDKTGNQSEWTEWIMGQSSVDSGPILDAIVDDIMTTEAGKALEEKLTGVNDALAQAVIEAALAEGANAIQQWVNYGQASAGIVEVKQTVANEKEAFAKYQQLVTAKFEGVEVNVTEVKEAQADVERAFGEFKDTVSARLQENEAVIQTKATTEFTHEGGKAIYNINAGITYNGQYYSAGMAIGVETTTDGVKSQVLFMADRFAVMTQAGGEWYTPFVIQNGQVIISQAFIGEGTITTAKIAEVIQSTDYVEGREGWRITKAGTAEFNNVTIRGTVYATNGVFSGRIESKDGYFAGTVYANKLVGDVVKAASIQGIVTSSGVVGSTSESVPVNTDWPVLQFETADFDRTLIISGNVTWGKTYSGNDLHIKLNGQTVRSFITEQSTAASTNSLSINIPARASGGRDIISIYYAHYHSGGGVRTPPSFAGATILVCKRGTSGVMVGPSAIPIS